MKILVTGGSGGIGKPLVQKLLAANHTVITPRSSEVNFLIEDSVLSNLDHEVYDVIIHLAYSSSSGKNTLKMMQSALRLKCKLFIHMSSWVVNLTAPITDHYTKSKKLCEQMLEASSHNFIIIRPSLVIGNDALIWQKNLHIFANCGTSKIWLVGVDEISNVILHNLESQSRKIFDLYGTPISGKSICSLFQYRRSSLMALIFRLCKPILKNISVFAFLKTKIDEKDEKVLPKECFTASGLKILQPRSKQELIQILECRGEECQIFGRQATTLFKHFRSSIAPKINLKIDGSKCNKFLHYEDGFITMEAGTVIYELFDVLDQFDRTIRCVPEYTDISLGACVKTQVHGSSKKYHTFSEQITNLEVWRQSCLMSIQSNEVQKNDLILSVTIRTIPNTPITRCIESQKIQQSLSAEKLLDILSLSMAPTVVWFVPEKKILIWHHHEMADGHMFKKHWRIRRYNYFLSYWKHLFLPKKIYHNQGHHLLGSWRNFTFGEKFFLTHNLLTPDAVIEICIPFSDIPRMLESIPKSFKVPFIGFRSSSKGVWCEFLLQADEKKIFDALNYEKHLGKYH